MADDFRPDEGDRIVVQDSAEPERYGRRGRRIMTGLVAVAAILGFGVVLVYAYNKGKQDGTSGAPPIIQAKEGPSKIRPENPGGMKVPNRDKEVFTRLETEKQAGKVERLLPSPEKPMTPPAPPAMKPEELAKMEPAAGTKPAETAADTMEAEPPPAPPEAPPAKAEAAPTVVKQLAAKPPKAPPVKKAAPKPKPAAKKTTVAKRTTSGAYRVQISSLRSQSAVQKSWVALRKRHSDLLGKLALSIEPVTLKGGKGTYYRMQAGPFASRNSATALCASLKKRKQSCIVVRR